MLRPCRAVAPLVLAAAVPASAQANATVSPVAYATTEANGSSTLPWQAFPSFQPSRWLAIHGDLGSGAKVIRSLAYRRDAAAPVQAGTRTLDVEISMGASVPHDRPSWVFARNWTGTPTVVLPRQIVNLGPYVGASRPAPFELRLLFTAPFVHLGQGALAYEALIFGNTSGGMTSGVDAAVPTAGGGFPGLPQSTGCTVTGQPGPMRLTISHGVSGSVYTFGAVVQDAPPNAPTVLAFGTQNPSLAVPGLCAVLATDLVATLELGPSDATGVLAEALSAGGTTFYLPSGPSCLAVGNTFPNATFYVQAHSLDVMSGWPIPVASSNGLVVYVPPAAAPITDRVTTLFTVDPSPAHPSALFVSNGIGYALVTEFTW